jgi:benzoate/toluate 1,2-dioxygenase reductase subunit
VQGRVRSYDLGEYIEDALSKTEADTGYALACQMRPKSDCVVFIAASSAVCKTKQEDYVTTIKDVARALDSTFALVLQGEALKNLCSRPGSTPISGAR